MDKEAEILNNISLQEQIILIADVLAEFILDKSEDERSEAENRALQKFLEIKQILESESNIGTKNQK